MIPVSHRPELFRTALNFHNECGAYQLRAVLNMFGRDAPPEEMYWSDWMRRRDWSLPPLMPSILARYDVRAHWHFWPRGSFARRILAALYRDEPILFVINSIVKPGGGLHWISVWGYDKATDEFLIYDSKAPEASGTPGNTRYAASLLHSHLPWFGTFVLSIEGELH